MTLTSLQGFAARWRCRSVARAYDLRTNSSAEIISRTKFRLRSSLPDARRATGGCRSALGISSYSVKRLRDRLRGCSSSADGRSSVMSRPSRGYKQSASGPHQRPKRRGGCIMLRTVIAVAASMIGILASPPRDAGAVNHRAPSSSPATPCASRTKRAIHRPAGVVRNGRRIVARFREIDVQEVRTARRLRPGRAYL
jgi:hypothetical protein